MPNLVHFYYIHPGNAQCRIYHAGPHDLDVNPNLSPRHSYAANPQSWREVGLMNYHGKLVCLDPHHPKVWEDMKSQEPLMGGLSFTYTPEGDPA